MDSIVFDLAAISPVPPPLLSPPLIFPQNNVDGTPFVKNLKTAGVIPGIKVDMGLSPLPGGHPVETWCTGLDGLVERAQKYYAQGKLSFRSASLSSLLSSFSCFVSSTF